MKTILKLMVPLALSTLLVGCGNSSSQSGSTKKAETTTSQSAKKKDTKTTTTADKTSSSSAVSSSSASSNGANYTVQSSSTTSADSTSSTTADSDATTSQSADQTSSSTTQGPTINQNTLTERIYRLMSGAYARQDLIMQITQTSTNIYTVQVRENHQSPNMRAKYVDPNTSPTVAWFKTNSTGQLLQSKDGGATYYVVGTAY